LYIVVLYCSLAFSIGYGQVLNLVPKEQDGEKFDDALNRVRRCVGGRTEANTADSDSDIEIMADSVSVNVRCPVSTLAITLDSEILNEFLVCWVIGLTYI
jgi:hypothetical protein